MTKDSSLSIFDIDDTLFRTQATVHIEKDGKIIKSMSSHAYANYKMGPGEKINYSDFRSSETFAKSAQPVKLVFNTVKRMMDRMRGEHQRFIIVTARSDFDNKELFLDTFRKYGFDIDRSHVYRAGNIDMPSALAKKQIIARELQKHPYYNVRFFDDSTENLDAFLDLTHFFPDTKFEAFLITLDGNIQRYNKLHEDGMGGGAPANAAGGGAIAGIGVGPKGEPGGPKNILARLRRKKPINEDGSFGGHPVFKVSDEFYHRCYHGKKNAHKYERYVGNDEMGEKIRQYGRHRKNLGKPIIIQNERTGAMLYLKKGKK